MRFEGLDAPVILGIAAAIAGTALLYANNKKKTQESCSGTTKPRDDAKVKAARDHLTPLVLDKLKELDYKIDGDVLLAPEGVGVDEDATAEQYHAQRERPFYLNCANYPSAIVLVKSFKDVQNTIKLMSTLDSQKFKLCIAAGCHSAYCMVDNSIVIDLQNLKNCTLDVDSSTIAVQGGAKILDVHECLKGSGLGFATGTNQDTGVSGLTLQGGAGWLGGQAGFACDTVIKAQVVLPSGELVTATDDNEHADLLRALRGGGGNFGVVVEWTFNLFDVTSAMAGTIVHFCPTVSSVKKVLGSYQEKIKDIPDQCGSAFALPCGAPVTANVLTMVGNEVPKSGDYKEVPFFSNIVNLGAWFKIQNDLGTKEYFKDVAPILEPMQQPCYGHPIGAMIYSMDEAILDALIHYSRVDYPKSNRAGSAIIIQSLTGKTRSREYGARSSLRHRQAIAWVVIDAQWDPKASEEEIQTVIEWAHRCKNKLIELGGEDGPHEFADSDGRRIKFSTNEQRKFLEGAKTKYDPDNLMALNKNIVITHTE